MRPSDNICSNSCRVQTRADSVGVAGGAAWDQLAECWWCVEVTTAADGRRGAATVYTDRFTWSLGRSADIQLIHL